MNMDKIDKFVDAVLPRLYIAYTVVAVIALGALLVKTVFFTEAGY